MYSTVRKTLNIKHKCCTRPESPNINYPQTCSEGDLICTYHTGPDQCGFSSAASMGIAAKTSAPSFLGPLSHRFKAPDQLFACDIHGRCFVSLAQQFPCFQASFVPLAGVCAEYSVRRPFSTSPYVMPQIRTYQEASSMHQGNSHSQVHRRQNLALLLHLVCAPASRVQQRCMHATFK